MRYLIFVGLLALQVVLSTCDEPELIVLEPGYDLELEARQPRGRLLNCTLEKNGTTYPVYPKNESPGEYYGYDDDCAVVIRNGDEKWAGLWTMTTITDEEQFTTQFRVRFSRRLNGRINRSAKRMLPWLSIAHEILGGGWVDLIDKIPHLDELHETKDPIKSLQKKNVRVTPTSYIDAYAGQYVTVALDINDTDIKTCSVTFPNRNVRDIMKESIEGVELLDGTCGMRIRANRSFTGQWEFQAQIGEDLIKYAEFRIDVPFQSDADDEIEVIRQTWILGKGKQSVDLYNLGASFCQLTRPDGTVMPMAFGNCKMEVPVASALHEGTWRVTYAKTGLMKLQRKDIVIKVKDLTSLEASYSYGTDGKINLLCKTGSSKMKFCSFIRPDKYMINVPLGVGNGNYSYYGNGFNNRYDSDLEFGECGVTIHKPSDVDFGLWTCEMGMSDNNIQATVIEVKNQRAGEIGRANKAENPPIYVKRDDSFKINCKAPAALNYCWLTSPNGTNFGVAPGKGSGKILEYDGKGFSMGECGAIVAKSNTTDNGEWTCHMGLVGGFEAEQKVSVKVSEYYLRAEDETVYADKNAKLTCRTVIGDEATLRYCRWVRPNGKGINKAESSRFQLSQGVDQCSLTVSDLQTEDLGKWSCFGALSKFTGREEVATVELRSKQVEEAQIASVLSIVLGTALLLVTLLGAGFAALFIYKRRKARVMKNPPPYYAQEYAMPDEIRANADPIPEKDYKY